jgi:hypothetical protein
MLLQVAHAVRQNIRGAYVRGPVLTGHCITPGARPYFRAISDC